MSTRTFSRFSVCYFTLAIMPLIGIVFFYSPWSAVDSDRFPSMYKASRDDLLAMEKERRLGGKVTLSEKEKNMNTILMAMKDLEFQEGLSGKPFPSAMHFFHAKPLIDKSEVFDVIRMMPKGAALHLHGTALASIPWVISELTYLPALYYCRDIAGTHRRLHFRFSLQGSPSPMQHCTDWELMADARTKLGNSALFDDWLFHNMSMMTKSPRTAYPDTNKAWEKFKLCLFHTAQFLYTEESFEKYVFRALQELNEDNVQYIEIRYGINSRIRTNNGSERTKEYTLQKYIKTVEKFKENNPDFFGAKFISQSVRLVNNSIMEEDIKRAIYYRRTYPEIYAGHDIVIQEDKSYPLLHYIDELLIPSRDNVSLPFFFHAGETDWQGTFVDENIFDAILLNASRIGHAYSITKHPVAMKLVQSKDIGIEVNPISNQVLGLVSDLRNHPVASLFAEDFPIVISSDDPAPWGATPMSHDFYQAFMGLGGRAADLATLKQLALNSIKYSATADAEKAAILALWTNKWNTFLDKIISKYGTKYLQKNKQS